MIEESNDADEVAEACEGIRRGLADIEAGRVRPAEEVFGELDRKLGIQD
jgi:predicted transcriptional regulator